MKYRVYIERETEEMSGHGFYITESKERTFDSVADIQSWLDKNPEFNTVDIVKVARKGYFEPRLAYYYKGILTKKANEHITPVKALYHLKIKKG